MTDDASQNLLSHLRGMADGDLTDQALLTRFLTERSETAFAALVARHGPMVLGVSRRVLASAHDAEEVCQAAFLALARSGGAIRRGASLASWLHGVALRLARRLRTAQNRRHRREMRAAAPRPASPEGEASWREVLAALDEELQRLPEPLRGPLVLCYLEGHTRDEAAAALGVPVSTLRGRLDLGRARLRTALEGRGVTLPAALLGAAVVAAPARAAVPPRLAAATARLAAGGRAVAAGARVEALVRAATAPGLVPLSAAGVALTAVMAALSLGALGLGRPTPAGTVLAAAPPPAPEAAPRWDALPQGAAARLGSAHLRTSASQLALSPDGKTLRTLTGVRTVGRWDAGSGRLLGEVYLETPVDARGVLSPDGAWVAVAETEAVGLYDTATGRRLRTVAVLKSLELITLAFSPDGRTLATSEYVRAERAESHFGRVRLWPLEGGKPREVARLPSYTNGLAFSPDGRRLYAAVDNHSLRCWETATLRPLWVNDHWARRVDLSPDGTLLLSDTYQDGPLRLWDARTGEPVTTLETGRRRWTLTATFSPDGTTIAHGTVDGVDVWDVASRKRLRTLPENTSNVAFTPDSRSLHTLATTLGCWDVRTGTALHGARGPDGHVGSVLSLAFTPDGRSLVTTGQDATLRLWDTTRGSHRVLREEKERSRSSFTALGFSDEGLLLAYPDQGELELVDPSNGRRRRQFVLPWKVGTRTTLVGATRVESGNRLLAVGVADPLDFGGGFAGPRTGPFVGWDLASGKVTTEDDHFESSGQGVALSPGGRFLVRTGHAELLDIATRKARPLVGAPTTLFSPAFSPDGRWVGLADANEGVPLGQPGAIFIYKVLTGRQIARVRGAQAVRTCMAFSADGRRLAAIGPDALRVWETTTGRPVLDLLARGRLRHWDGLNFASCLATAPDGQVVATGHANGTVFLWNVPPIPPPAARPLDATCWADLADLDPRIAWRAVDRLVAAPDAALALLRERLRPDVVEAGWLTRRLTDLGSDDFATRQRASADLERVGEVVEPELRAAAGTADSLEVRLRVRALLERLSPAVPPSDTLRALRAVAVLERIGTPQAKALLGALAGGSPGAPLTREAKATLRRTR